ncbi:MAG: FAD binding domain-containing protein [Candidatus Glassbacteria bacterium]
MKLTEYYRPSTLEEALRLRTKKPDARFIAGGTDLLVRIRAGVERPTVLISLRNIEELKGINLGKSTEIGSMTTISEILEHPTLGEAYPVLLDAARPFASMQIRNQATVGGNLCNASPCADMAQVLLVLDARVRIAGPGGRREMSLNEFFLGEGKTHLSPDEVLTSIVIDELPPQARASYMKKRRVQMDLALVSVAVLLEMNGARCTRARVAAGAVAPRPLRLRGVEDQLEDQRIDSNLLMRASELAKQEVSPITDVRTSAEYRRHMTGVLFRRAAEKVLDGRNDES